MEKVETKRRTRLILRFHMGDTMTQWGLSWETRETKKGDKTKLETLGSKVPRFLHLAHTSHAIGTRRPLLLEIETQQLTAVGNSEAQWEIRPKRRWETRWERKADKVPRLQMPDAVRRTVKNKLGDTGRQGCNGSRDPAHTCEGEERDTTPCF